MNLYRQKIVLPVRRVRDSDRYAQSEQQARMSAALARLEYVQRYSLNLSAQENDNAE